MKIFFTALTFVVLLCLIFGGFNNKLEDNNIKITFSSWGSESEINIIKSLIKNFEKDNPNIKVEFIHIPQNYFQKLHLLFASGLQPDIVFMNNQNISMYINASLLEDLTPYFSDIKDNFYKEALNCFIQDNKIYAIPRDISNLVIYYNKDIFSKLNLKMPEKIKDINELKELAKKVTTKENWGINFEKKSLYWLYYLSSNGGGIISDDVKKIIIDKKESIEALNLYADMINKDKSMPNKVNVGSMTTAQMFINGKLAMYLSGRWMVPKFRETIQFNWDVVEFPAKNEVYIDASGYAISKQSKHKNEAVKFIKYLTSKKSMEEFSKSGLIIPSNKQAIFQNKNEKPLNCKVFKTMLTQAKPTPVTENYATINDIINEKTEKIFNGEKKADEVFDRKTIEQLENLL